MEKELEKSRSGQPEDNNNEELMSMEVEDQSEASTASSLNIQQQQRKLWRSKSTVKSQELSIDSSNVTNEELKELKQWFQVYKIDNLLFRTHLKRKNGGIIFYIFLFSLFKSLFKRKGRIILYFSFTRNAGRPGAKRKPDSPRMVQTFKKIVNDLCVCVCVSLGTRKKIGCLILHLSCSEMFFK